MKQLLITIIALCVFVISVSRITQNRMLQDNQEQRIIRLVIFLTDFHGYSIVDIEGRPFRLYVKEKTGYLRPLYYISALLSGNKLMSSSDYDLVYVFPEGAQNDRIFKLIIQDLRDPKTLFAKIPPDYVPSKKIESDYFIARSYFCNQLDLRKDVYVYFVTNADGSFLFRGEHSVANRMTISVPVSSARTSDF